MLTRKQNELLNYIGNHMEKYEVPPSFDEMRNALGLASKSGIHRLVSGLEERGYIRRLANRARAIEILKPIHNSSIMVRAVETHKSRHTATSWTHCGWHPDRSVKRPNKSDRTSSKHGGQWGTFCA